MAHQDIGLLVVSSIHDRMAFFLNNWSKNIINIDKCLNFTLRSLGTYTNLLSVC